MGSVACNGSPADKAFLTMSFYQYVGKKVHYYDDVNNQFSGTLSSEWFRLRFSLLSVSLNYSFDSVLPSISWFVEEENNSCIDHLNHNASSYSFHLQILDSSTKNHAFYHVRT